MKEYTVLYEHGETSWGAVVPDLPGCFSIGDTRDQAEANVKEAIELYIGELKSRNEPIPEPRHTVGSVIVAA